MVFLPSSSDRRNVTEKRKRKPRRRLMMTPRKRKCSPAWEPISEASWPRSDSSGGDGKSVDISMKIQRMTVDGVCSVPG